MFKYADGHISYTAHMPSMSITAYHSYNPHGDTTLLTSSTGAEWVDYSYDAFGGQLDPNGLSFGYTGKWQRQHDNATKMIRMGVREYDPALGRFISTDPLKGTSTNPQSQNRYGYALNNPLSVYDLDGRLAIPNPCDYAGGACGLVEDAARDVWNFGSTINDYTPTGIIWDYNMAWYDFGSNFVEMKYINKDTMNSRYYHCKANYEATKRGLAGRPTAWLLSGFREEVFDRANHWGEDISEDSAGDYRANERGRKGCLEGLSLEEACPYEGPYE